MGTKKPAATSGKRRSRADYATAAARLAKMTGQPIRAQWARENDIRHGFLRTTSVERISVAPDKDDKVTGWHHVSVAPSILSRFAPDGGDQCFIETGVGHADMPFDIANIRCANAKALAHARIGWFRAGSNIPRPWAVQSFIGELADELGRDQKDMLLELIGPPRLLDVANAGMPEDFWT